MPLTIKVLRYKGRPLREEEKLQAVFGRDEGTLGRAQQNHLHLPDPEKAVSGKHAIISYEDGFYYLKDISQNGTFFCNKNRHIHRESVQIDDGDRLQIGDYDLIVYIKDNHHLGPPVPAPVLVPDDFAFVDILKGPDVANQTHEERYPSGGLEVRPHHEPMDPPRVIEPPAPTPGLIPNDFAFVDIFKVDIFKKEGERSTDSEYPKVPVPPSLDNRQEWQNEPMKAPHGDELFDIFLEAAGIKDKSFCHEEDIPELMRAVGSLFREMTDKLVTILQGRSDWKSQIRVPVTRLQRDYNNPLKFSLSIEETMKLLLTKNNPRYIDGIEAVREGYADIMNHQLATNAGVQSAVIELLKRFDPQHFEKQYEEGIIFQRKAKCWDAYCRDYQHITDEALEDFFGGAFARAYEEQLSKLRPRDNKS